MARPLPVNLLMAGTGAVLLVSGLGKQSIGEVLKGNFGELKPPTERATAAGVSGSGVFQNVSNVGGGGEGVAESSPTSSTFAPSPDTFHKHATRQQEAKSIAAILLSRGIRNPTHSDIEDARRFYHSR